MESWIRAVQIRQMAKTGTANGHQNGHQIVVPEQVRVMTGYERITLKNGENGRYFLRVGEQIQPPQPICPLQLTQLQGVPSFRPNPSQNPWNPMRTHKTRENLATILLQDLGVQGPFSRSPRRCLRPYPPRFASATLHVVLPSGAYMRACVQTQSRPRARLH